LTAKQFEAAGNLEDLRLFPSGNKKILVERHRLFTDLVVQKDRIIGEAVMKASSVIVSLAISMIGTGPAMAQNAPPVSTTKVEGTDNVYVFR
jgi:hypothetical protein